MKKKDMFDFYFKLLKELKEQKNVMFLREI